MMIIFALRDAQDRPVIHRAEVEKGHPADAVLVWQGLDWRTPDGDTNPDLVVKVCAELWSVYTTPDQTAYVKRALSNTNGWTVSDDCRDWQPPAPPAEWVEHEQEQRYPDEADGREVYIASFCPATGGQNTFAQTSVAAIASALMDEKAQLQNQLFEATVHTQWQAAIIKRQQEVLQIASDALGRFHTLEAQGHELTADLDRIEAGLKNVVDEYLKLAHLVVDWYTARPYDEPDATEALRCEARRLSDTPESAWL